MPEIRIYVEGGAGGKQSAFMRTGFQAFFHELRQQARCRSLPFRVILCGNRRSTYDDFCLALKSHPKDLNFLLVDADTPVSVNSPWRHLAGHPQDPWTDPGAGDERCHLMVCVMESWFVADVDALERFYGKGFHLASLPLVADVESVEKDRILASLATATRRVQAGTYHKTRHAPALLQTLDAAKVRAKAPHCNRLFRTIETLIAGL